MKNTKKKARIQIELTAIWGDGTANSTIRVSRRRWKEIQLGKEFHKTTWAWSEEGRELVSWSFKDGLVSINGDDCAQRVVDEPVSFLFAGNVGGEDAG